MNYLKIFLANRVFGVAFFLCCFLGVSILSHASFPVESSIHQELQSDDVILSIKDCNERLSIDSTQFSKWVIDEDFRQREIERGHKEFKRGLRFARLAFISSLLMLIFPFFFISAIILSISGVSRMRKALAIYREFHYNLSKKEKSKVKYVNGVFIGVSIFIFLMLLLYTLIFVFVIMTL